MDGACMRGVVCGKELAQGWSGCVAGRVDGLGLNVLGVPMCTVYGPHMNSDGVRRKKRTT